MAWLVADPSIPNFGKADFAPLIDDLRRLPLGKRRTNCFADLAFILWLLTDKFSWNESPLCKQHQQVRLRYEKHTLDDVIERQIDIFLTYSLESDLLELMACSKIWWHEYDQLQRALSVDMCNRSWRDSFWPQIRSVRFLLTMADDPYKTDEFEGTQRFRDALAAAALFRRSRPGQVHDEDVDVLLFVCSVERKASAQSLQRAAPGIDARWPMDDAIIYQASIIREHQDMAYKADFLERLLAVRPKLDEDPCFYSMDDLDAIINMVEEAHVREKLREIQERKHADATSGFRQRVAHPDIEFLDTFSMDRSAARLRPALKQIGYFASYTPDEVEVMIAGLLKALCNFDIDDDLESVMSDIRKVRIWVDIRESSNITYHAPLSKALKEFVRILPESKRYDGELRQAAKQTKINDDLTDMGRMALSKDSHGRERCGWSHDAASFMLMLEAKVTGTVIYTQAKSKQDLDVNGEIRDLLTILSSYEIEEIDASPTLYYRIRDAVRTTHLSLDPDIKNGVERLLGVISECTAVKANEEDGKRQLYSLIKYDRFICRRLVGTQSEDTFVEQVVEPLWPIEPEGWTNDMNFLVFLLKRKWMQVPKEAKWRQASSGSFSVECEIELILDIMLRYEDADIPETDPDFDRCLAELIDARQLLDDFECLPEEPRIDELIARLSETGEIQIGLDLGTATTLRLRGGMLIERTSIFNYDYQTGEPIYRSLDEVVTSSVSLSGICQAGDSSNLQKPAVIAPHQQHHRNGWQLDLAVFVELLDAKISNTTFHTPPSSSGRFGIDIVLSSMASTVLSYPIEDIQPSSSNLDRLKLAYDKLRRMQNSKERRDVMKIIEMLQVAADERTPERDHDAKQDLDT